VKPINENTLFATIQLAIENFNTNAISESINEVDYFFIKAGKNNCKVYWNDVYHIESIKNYVKISTYARQKNLLIRSSLVNFVNNILPSKYAANYLKISRAELLLKHIILQYDKNTIVTTQGNFEYSSEVKV
jgi:hypothetical protein